MGTTKIGTLKGSPKIWTQKWDPKWEPQSRDPKVGTPEWDPKMETLNGIRNGSPLNWEAPK